MAEVLRRLLFMEFSGGSLLEDTLPAAMSLVALHVKNADGGVVSQICKAIHPSSHPSTHSFLIHIPMQRLGALQQSFYSRL